LVTLCVLLAVPLFPLAALAQDDAPSLGDLARNLRKNKMQQQPQQQPDTALTVIDNDNLAQVMGMPRKQGRSNKTRPCFPLTLPAIM